MGRKSKASQKAFQRKTAALMAAGLSKEEIAKRVDRAPDTVQDVVCIVNQGKDPELKAVFDRARERIEGKLLATMEKHTQTLDDALSDPLVQAKDKAQVYRAITDGLDKVMDRPVVSQPGGVSVNIDVKDPATLAAMIGALRMLNEQPRTIEVQSREVEP